MTFLKGLRMKNPIKKQNKELIELNENSYLIFQNFYITEPDIESWVRDKNLAFNDQCKYFTKLVRNIFVVNHGVEHNIKLIQDFANST